MNSLFNHKKIFSLWSHFNQTHECCCKTLVRILGINFVVVCTDNHHNKDSDELYTHKMNGVSCYAIWEMYTLSNQLQLQKKLD